MEVTANIRGLTELALQLSALLLEMFKDILTTQILHHFPKKKKKIFNALQNVKNIEKSFLHDV